MQEAPSAKGKKEKEITQVVPNYGYRYENSIKIESAQKHRTGGI